MYRRSPRQRDSRPFTGDYGPDPDFDPHWRVPEIHDRRDREEAPFPREGPGGNWDRPREDFMSRRNRRSRSSENFKGRRSPMEYSHHRSGPDQPSGYPEHRMMSPQNFEERRGPPSPQRFPREKLPSLMNFDHGRRHASPDWGRKERMDHPDRHEGGFGREARGARGGRGFSPRGREFNRPHNRRPQDRMEPGRSYQEEHNQAAYRERSPQFDRSQPKRSEFRDQRPEKRARDSWSHYEDEPERPYARGGAPFPVEHSHGTSQRGGGDRGQEHHAPRHEGPPPDRQRRQEGPRNEQLMDPHSKRRRSPPPPAFMGQSKRQEPAGGDCDVPHLFQKRQAAPKPPPPLLSLDVDLRKTREDQGAFLGKKWEQKRPEDNQQRRKGPDMGSQMEPYHRDSGQVKHSNVNREMPSTSRGDPSEWETLKIRVDMSRPTGQDSGSLGYSSDRQLSLDLVNVGRQRLDFLPMLEHSGTFRETPLHTGTFAQEIITLVHQVKEMYFKGNTTSTLNSRFSSIMTSTPEPDEEPVANRRINVSVPVAEALPLFSKIGNPEPQRRPQAFDPGDLRHDIERRRQERLEEVKITITGASFPPASKVEGEFMFEQQEQERRGYDDDAPNWPEEAPEERRDWSEQPNDMRHRMSWSGRRNRRRPFRSGPQSGPNRRQYHNSANGGNW